MYKCQEQSASAPFGGDGFGNQWATPLGGGSEFLQQTSNQFGGGCAGGGAGGFGDRAAPFGGGVFMQQAASGGGSRAFLYQPTPKTDTSGKYLLSRLCYNMLLDVSKNYL